MMTVSLDSEMGKTSRAQNLLRILLGAVLIFAGFNHLTVARVEFQAQVPIWLPLDRDLVVVLSGMVELILGAALIFAPRRFHPWVGWIVAAFFVAIFPGNISQYVNRIDAFQLNSDQARLMRLFFQPALVVWAIWATGAWAAWRAWRKRQSARQ